MPNQTTQMEGEVFFPSQDIIDQAHIPDWEKVAAAARKDPQGFWAGCAAELEWFKSSGCRPATSQRGSAPRNGPHIDQ